MFKVHLSVKIAYRGVIFLFSVETRSSTYSTRLRVTSSDFIKNKITLFFIINWLFILFISHPRHQSHLLLLFNLLKFTKHLCGIFCCFYLVACIYNYSFFIDKIGCSQRSHICFSIIFLFFPCIIS